MLKVAGGKLAQLESCGGNVRSRRHSYACSSTRGDNHADQMGVKSQQKAEATASHRYLPLKRKTMQLMHALRLTRPSHLFYL